MFTGNYISAVSIPHKLDEASYLNQIPAVQYLTQGHVLHLTRPVTFFVGENGTGKSTLLEAIAVGYGFNPEGGSKHFNFSTCASHSDLYQSIRLARSSYPRDGFFLRAESFYNVSTNIDALDSERSFGSRIINSYGGVSLHHQSHGESFLALVQHRFAGQGLYILDEPEAALSPMRLLTLMGEMHQLVQNKSQFIIATHSPMLMAFPNAEIFTFSDAAIQSTPYQQTAHFQLTKRFLDNPEKALAQVLYP